MKLVFQGSVGLTWTPPDCLRPLIPCHHCASCLRKGEEVSSQNVKG